MQLVGRNWPSLQNIAKHCAKRDGKRRRISYPGKAKNRGTPSQQRRPLKTNPKQRQTQLEDEAPPSLPGGESTHEQHH
ncbi:hypothetical protein D3C76_660450 [compost metagenome]